MGTVSKNDPLKGQSEMIDTITNRKGNSSVSIG